MISTERAYGPNSNKDRFFYVLWQLPVDAPGCRAAGYVDNRSFRIEEDEDPFAVVESCQPKHDPRCCGAEYHLAELEEVEDERSCRVRYPRKIITEYTVEDPL